MSNVITQIDMQKYRGEDSAVFPAGTVVTPSAKDWAKEQNIRIVIDGLCYNEVNTYHTKAGALNKDECLKLTVKAVVNEFKQKGLPLKNDLIVKAVVICLEKLGCSVEK